MATRNELGRLPIKLAIVTFIIKFWIHLQSLPENNIAKQCLQLSKEMADKNQSGLMQKNRSTLHQVQFEFYHMKTTRNFLFLILSKTLEKR